MGSAVAVAAAAMSMVAVAMMIFESFCSDGICVVDGIWSSCGALSLGFVLIRWQEHRNTCWPR